MFKVRAISLAVCMMFDAGITMAAAATPAPVRYGSYSWPVIGPVIRGFESPTSAYTAGHRGIDIAVPYGTPVACAQAGTVSFAGKVAGSLYVSVDHPDGIRTTYSWLSAVSVKKGQVVAAGVTIGSSGTGHPGADTPHLHFGARLNGQYIDPLPLLGPLDLRNLVHLAALPSADPMPVGAVSGP
jgi:murein DD-endopeptidase MepM/ murein hydrolase activator NlpD